VIRTIVVPLDGSPLAARALLCAEPLALAADARVLLVRAGGTPPDEEWDERSALARARSELAETAERLRRRGVQADWRVEPGDARAAIIRTAREAPADMVVMGTHGRGVPTEWPHGSVADAVVRDAAGLPVLLVPASCQPSHARGPRVAVLLDGSSFAEQVLPAAGDLARAMAGRVALLRVAQTGDAVGTDGIRAHLELVKRAPALDGIPVEVHTAEGDVAAHALGASVAADVVAMTTHGQSGHPSVLMGSVAAAVLRRARCPVLLLRPTGLRAAAA